MKLTSRQLKNLIKEEIENTQDIQEMAMKNFES